MPIKINITSLLKGDLELEEDHRFTRRCAWLDSTWWALDTYPMGRGGGESESCVAPVAGAGAGGYGSS